MKRSIVLLLCMTIGMGMLQGCGNKKQAVENNASVSGTAGAAVETGKEEASGADANVNAEGFPIVKEPLTLTVYGARDQNQAAWDEVLVLQKYEEMSNIHMDYQEVPQDGFEENKPNTRRCESESHSALCFFWI